MTVGEANFHNMFEEKPGRFVLEQSEVNFAISES